MNTKRFIYLLFCGSIISAMIAACSATQHSSRPGDTTPKEQPQTKQQIAENNAISQLLNAHRSKLSDIYLTQKQDIPSAFLQKDTTQNNAVVNPYAGYRIQILSSQNVHLADSVSTEFRLWADSTLTGYTPKAYVLFNQPYFKVHVGDFQNREKAYSLSRIIKNKYPDAWVVHDRIDPQFVPADTTTFKIKKKDNRP